MDEVQYHEDCTLRGAPGTVVEVVGEIHFLQNAWLDGSLRFVKAKGSQKAALPMQHRCLDVEGSLEFLDPDVEFINCGSDSTDDGGAFYVEQNVTVSNGRVVARGSKAKWGAAAYVGGSFTMTGGSLLIENSTAGESGGGLYVKDGDFHHLGGNVTMFNSIAGIYGGGVYMNRGKYHLAGYLRFENCFATSAGGGLQARNFQRKNFGAFNQTPSGVLEAKNCTAGLQYGEGGVMATQDSIVAGRVLVDGCRGSTAGCFEAKRLLDIKSTGSVVLRNCRAENYGGAFMGTAAAVRGKLDVINCSASVGGTIYAVRRLFFAEGSLVRIENSSAATQGGAIWAGVISQGGGEISFRNCRSAMKGGAINSNEVFRQEAGSTSFTSCSSRLGGAMFVLALEAKGNMTFQDCLGAGPGGAIHAVGAVEQLSTDSYMTFKRCKSKKSGGAIFAVYLSQQGHMQFLSCKARRSGGAASINDAVNMENIGGAKSKASDSDEDSPSASTSTRRALLRYAPKLKGVKGMVLLNGSSEFRGCKAGAGGALFARNDVLLTRKLGHASFLNCIADAFGGALHGRDIQLLGDVLFRNVSALAGGVIQSVGSVEVPGAVMQQTSAPQISALKLIQMSNVSVENTSHVWFVAPEIHLKDVRCDNGLASFKEPHHVGCRSCEENKLQVSGGPVLDDELPTKQCWPAPRGTAEIDTYHLKLKKGFMTQKANITRSFRCPNRMACVGGSVSTDGWGAMCADGYEGQGCTKCATDFGPADNTVFVCVRCPSQSWQQNFQMSRFVLQDLLLFGLSVMGVSSSTRKVDSKILTNHFMSFVAAAGPVLQAVQETPTFSHIMQSLEYLERVSSAVDEDSGSTGISARCILNYLSLPTHWWARIMLNLLTPFLSVLALTLLRGWRIAVVVGVNCFLPKVCLCFARYLVCYRMEPEHEGGQLFCEWALYTNFSLLSLLLVVASIALAGPALWWMLLGDEEHKDEPFYLYLTASYKEEWKSWEATRLIRKVFLAIICAALPISLHPAMQIMCISLVLLTALVLEMQFRPYKDNRWNLEEKILLTVSLAMVSVTSCFLANEYHWSSTHRNQCFLLTLILLLCIVPSTILIVLILHQLLREKGILKGTPTEKVEETQEPRSHSSSD